MTGREWQPGDVAMVTVALGSREGRTEKAWLNSDGCWVFADGEAFHSSRPDLVKSVRPLVVIDLESAEDMERLAAAWEAITDSGPLPDERMTVHALRMRAALREFASPTPPKPDEPTRLGAVALDSKGVRWLAVTVADGYGPSRWAREGAIVGDWYAWSAIDVVKVLSPGVEAGEPSC